MILVALRGLSTRKLRTALTMIVIILGVSMIAGTYVLTDTINQSFTKIFKQANRATDAVITGKRVVQSEFALPPPLPARLLPLVKKVSGVAAADGEIADRAQLFTTGGKSLSSGPGPPTLLVSRPIPRFRSLTIVAGRNPTGNEIALDQTTMNRRSLRLGQTVGVSGAGPVEPFKIVGITRFGSVASIGGATIISMDLHAAQRIAGKQGEYDQIVLASKPGISQKELVRRLRAAIPPSLHNRVKVQTSEQQITSQTDAIGRGLNFLTIALLAFGGIAVFVGAFIIFNTFSITVAQRIREFALLRTVGATRSQVLRSVMVEALLIGLAASLIGLVAGLGIAKALGALFLAFGIDLPNAGLVIEPRTIIVGLVVGTVVTVAAGFVPSTRAMRVAPVAALHEGATLPRARLSRFSPLLALALGVLGALALIYGVFASISSASQRLLLIGFGAVMVFLGVAIISPRLVKPLASLIGWPIERVTSITGRLARENAVRSPSRTAITAAALMIGLALVGFVTIFAAELRKTANDTIDREVAGNFAIYGQARDRLIPAAIAPAVARLPGVGAVSSLGGDNARVAGIGTVMVTGIQSRTLPKVYRFQWVNGSSATVNAMGSHDALISKALADDHHLRPGSTLYVTTPVDRHDAFRVTGIYKGAQFLGSLSIPYATFQRDWETKKVQAVLVNGAPGQNLKVLKSRIHHLLLKKYPDAQVNSQQDIKNQTSQRINQLLALIYVLLAMSLVVSLFGIINTLILSIYERTREIGMLRAIGTSRAQVRWMVRWESVITAVIGAVLGLLLGIVFAVLVTAGLQSEGIEYALPIGQLLLWMVVAMVFGIVAAAFPARRAARLDVLQALAYE